MTNKINITTTTGTIGTRITVFVGDTTIGWAYKFTDRKWQVYYLGANASCAEQVGTTTKRDAIEWLTDAAKRRGGIA